MECPYCKAYVVVPKENRVVINQPGAKGDTVTALCHFFCPNSDCNQLIVAMLRGTYPPQNTLAFGGFGAHSIELDEVEVLWPRGVARKAPSEAPPDTGRDFEEAAAVLLMSPRASAALSRRCLQFVLRDAGEVKHRNLADEIDEAAKALPSHLADDLHYLRKIGNFAAHPDKDATGRIIPVEPGEAEWLLEVLAGLFDHYYVKPKRAESRRRALDQKLVDAGKEPVNPLPDDPEGE